MTKAEAYKILDLQEGSSKLEIKNQYKKLIKNNHPDKGGSKHISALLNEAKAILLKN
ncbi:MAG: DnaJ domain-containing protein [Alphaproteobacteria bacterium]|nr:DnaJ domain-containing protein [Alphaproteobacteria bacterium]